MLPAKIWLWQKTPALRLLVPFVAGVLLQWNMQPSVMLAWLLLLFCIVLLVVISFLPLHFQFKAAPLKGVAITGFVVATAMCLVQWQDVRNNHLWFGNHYNEKESLVVTLQEPLIEKPNSYKALARVEELIRNDSIVPAKGKVILYFKKDAISGLSYGSQLWVFEKVAPIKNSGNPAGFDYVRYNLFSGITHQGYLTATDFIVLPRTNQSWLDNSIFRL